MNLGRTLKLGALTAAFIPLLIGCDAPGDKVPESGSTSPADGASNGTRLLSKVFYNGKLADEYTYDEAGKPLTHVHYQPVTGARSSVLTVVKMDDAGRVMEASDEGSTKSKVVYAYDGEGRRTSITRFDASGSETSRSTYVHEGDVITQTINAKGREERKIIYTLDGNGNVVSQQWIDGSRDQTHKFSDFDDSPNPWTLTARMYDAYPVPSHNYRSDVNHAGCAFTSVHQYDEDGLLIQTDSTGCKGPNGSPTTHQYRYEYLTP